MSFPQSLTLHCKVAFSKHMQQLAPTAVQFYSPASKASKLKCLHRDTKEAPERTLKVLSYAMVHNIPRFSVSKNGWATWHGHRLCCRCPCSRISYLHPSPPWAWQSGWPKVCAQLHTHCQQLHPVCRRETGQEAGTISFHRQPQFLWHFILISLLFKWKQSRLHINSKWYLLNC